MDQPTPDRSTGKREIRGEAERSMQTEHQPSASETNAGRNAVPEGDKRAGEDQAPAGQPKQDDGGLKTEKRIATQPVTRADRFAFWTLLATAGLSLATFILALATVDMAGSTRDLASFAKQQAHDTQDALAVARRQASAAETANRLVSAPEVSVSAANLGMPSVNMKLSGSFSVFNIGRTPASELQDQAKLVIAPPPQLPPSLVSCPTCPKTLLFPTQGFQGNGLFYDNAILPDALTETVVTSIKAGATFLYLIGRIDYLDSEKKHHYIALCDVLHADTATTGPCAAGNAAD